MGERLDARLVAMADREEIRDLARRYAHCVWQKDADGAVDLFAEDGVMDMGDRPPIEGRATLLQVYRETFVDSVLQPFVHNHVIDLDGDRATGTCYLDLRATMDGRSMIGAGCYDDVYRRVGGIWKFERRTLTLAHFVPLSEGWAEEP